MNEKKDLKTIRFEKNVTQAMLQRDSGVNQSRISMIERKLVDPTYVEKIKIATALGMLIDEIAWPDVPPPLKVPGLFDEDLPPKKERPLRDDHRN